MALMLDKRVNDLNSTALATKLESEIGRHGFVKLGDVLVDSQLCELSNLFSDIASDHAGQRWRGDQLAALLNLEELKPIRFLLHSLLQRPVALRAVAFRKTNTANWFVPPHQDRSIPIPTRYCPEGFSKPTRKGKHWQAEAPIPLLKKMLNIRIFIDSANELDGPLQVLPGTHYKGRLTNTEITKTTKKTAWESITGMAGDVLVMSPLLVHRSQRAVHPEGRRVLQIESLPFDFVSLYDLVGFEVPA